MVILSWCSIGMKKIISYNEWQLDSNTESFLKFILPKHNFFDQDWRTSVSVRSKWIEHDGTSIAGDLTELVGHMKNKQ